MRESTAKLKLASDTDETHVRALFTDVGAPCEEVEDLLAQLSSKYHPRGSSLDESIPLNRVRAHVDEVNFMDESMNTTMDAAEDGEHDLPSKVLQLCCIADVRLAACKIYSDLHVHAFCRRLQNNFQR